MLTLQGALSQIATSGVAVVYGGLQMGRKAVSDAAYQQLANDYYIGLTALTAVRTVTLAALAGLAAGQVIIVADESGNAGSFPITIAGSGSDTIDGLASVLVNVPYGIAILQKSGSGVWKLLYSSAYRLEPVTKVSDVAYTIKVSDRYVGYTALTAARIATLPTLASCQIGQQFVLADEAGAAGTNNLTLRGNGTEVIDGANTKAISTNYGVLKVQKVSASLWKVV